MQVKRIAECSLWSILQHFRPSLSYHLSLGPLFCLLLSGHFTQVSAWLKAMWVYKLSGALTPPLLVATTFLGVGDDNSLDSAAWREHQWSRQEAHFHCAKCRSRGGGGGGTGGPDPPGKSQVIWVSIGNKQLDPGKSWNPPGKWWTPSWTLKNDNFPWN